MKRNAKLRALAEAATPGPWHITTSNDEHWRREVREGAASTKGCATMKAPVSNVDGIWTVAYQGRGRDELRALGESLVEAAGPTVTAWCGSSLTATAHADAAFIAAANPKVVLALLDEIELLRENR